MAAAKTIEEYLESRRKHEERIRAHKADPKHVPPPIPRRQQRPGRQRTPYTPCTGDLSQPGSLVKSILATLNIQPTAGCGCEAFCRRMNAWGWIGCVRHRREILKWFQAKAAERCLTISAKTIGKLIIEAWRRSKTA